jgi:hypothetical protein
MKNCLLITRPNHDVTTNYLYFWSEIIISQAKRVGCKIIDLIGKRACLSDFSGIISKAFPELIIVNGHGDGETITGHDNQELVKSGHNESLLAGTVTYARSCRSAIGLGPACVKHKAKAYIGYTDDFVFLYDDQFITKPLEDNSAKMFLEPSNYVAISLLKGHSPKEANQRSKEMFMKNIQKLLTSETKGADKEAIPYLIWDMNHQVCLECGD